MLRRSPQGSPNAAAAGDTSPGFPGPKRFFSGVLALGGVLLRGVCSVWEMETASKKKQHSNLSEVDAKKKKTPVFKVSLRQLKTYKLSIPQGFWLHSVQNRFGSLFTGSVTLVRDQAVHLCIPGIHSSAAIASAREDMEHRQAETHKQTGLV